MSLRLYALPGAVFVVWWIARAGSAKQTIESEPGRSRLARFAP